MGDLYGNFDILDHFSRLFQLHATPHAPCNMLYTKYTLCEETSMFPRTTC